MDGLLTICGYDEAIGGVVFSEGSERLVYDRKKMVVLAMREGLTYEEAVEHIEFNIECADMGPHTPLIMHEFDIEQYD